MDWAASHPTNVQVSNNRLIKKIKNNQEYICPGYFVVLAHLFGKKKLQRQFWYDTFCSQNEELARAMPETSSVARVSIRQQKQARIRPPAGSEQPKHHQHATRLDSDSVDEHGDNESNGEDSDIVRLLVRTHQMRTQPPGHAKVLRDKKIAKRDTTGKDTKKSTIKVGRMPKRGATDLIVGRGWSASRKTYSTSLRCSGKCTQSSRSFGKRHKAVRKSCGATLTKRAREKGGSVGKGLRWVIIVMQTCGLRTEQDSREPRA
ncbi:hypothetical protein O9K51_00970 [Purpureocillium lavendulum]|uniref:Uncharacterized protein n=1 Tax=Purpureocillium lavendulum TaxID=1247861 RepID=A0AB34G415_9HYPO|nr:hypothetical protein O9K51_00970 [Purpureocillium lavendulum]